MVNTVYKKPRVSYSKIPVKSQTIPDQSMSIQEIVRRFVRGIPVDVVQRQPVYVDQSNHDLEAMSRMDFADKAFQAGEMRAQNEQVEAQIKAERQAMKEREAERKQSEDKARERERAGIVSLDNTMPDDTGGTKVSKRDRNS